MIASEKYAQPLATRTPFSAFLMDDKSSVGTGGDDDLGNFEESQFSYRRTRTA